MVLGDWVRVRHGFRGRVYAIHHQCPESDEWMAMQEIPVTAAQKRERWVSVLCHPAGAVCCPIDEAEVLDEPIRGFRNPYARMYFKEEG